MPIDPSIALQFHLPQVAPFPLANPLDQFNRMVTLRELMQRGQLTALQVEQTQRTMAAQDEINRVLQGQPPTPGAATTPGIAPGTMVPPTATTPPVSLPAIPGPAPTSPVTPPFLPSDGTAPAAPGTLEPTTTWPAPTGTTTPPFLPRVAGTPGGGMSLSDLMTKVPELLRRGGTYAIPTIQSIAQAAKADLDQRSALLDFHGKQADNMSKLVSGAIDDESLKRNLVDAANQRFISWDDARLYSGLGFNDPRTQAYLKSQGLSAYKYGEAVKVQSDINAEAMKRWEFGVKQEAQARADAWTNLQPVTEDTAAAKAKWLAGLDPYAQKLYAGTIGLPLDQLKMVVGTGAQAPKAGETVPRPAGVQAQKVEEAGAVGLAGAMAGITAQNVQNQALADAVKKDPTLFSRLSSADQTKLTPLLAQQGFTQFTTKPSDEELKQLYTLGRSVGALKDLQSQITDPKKEGMIGPLAGHVKDIPWFGGDAKVLEGQMDMVRSIVGDLIKGGTLRTTDLAVYQRMFPNI